MGHPAEGQQRVRGGHGRRAGRLHAAARSRYSAGLPGRDLEATDRRNARADQDESGAASQVRLRIRAQRHGQSLHDVRAARRLAACQSHGSPHRRGLCSRLEGFSRYPLLRTPRKSFWCKTISTPTPRLRSTKLFPPPKQGGWPNGSNGTTRQSMAVGSIWRSPNSASFRPSASIDASQTNKPSSTKSQLGRMIEMPTTPRPTGSSPQPTPVSNSSIYTRQSD